MHLSHMLLEKERHRKLTEKTASAFGRSVVGVRLYASQTNSTTPHVPESATLLVLEDCLSPQ